MEILFRGKSTTGEWIYGSYIKQKEYSLIRALGDDLEDVELIVDPETVGQYTSLQDKNGKKIYEGDILKIAKLVDGKYIYDYPPIPYPVNVVVKWDMCAWMWETLCEDKRYIGFPEAWCQYECEVIGNIYDNPELLEKEKGNKIKPIEYFYKPHLD